METAIRWSPSSNEHEQRFLIVDVAGKSLKQHRVVEYRNKILRSDEISRNNKVPAFRAFDWSSVNQDIVAVGQWSGETTVLSLSGESPAFSLPIKQQRQCNAVAFNSTSLLATGLERVRNDHCLNIYDLSQKVQEPSSPVSRFSKEVINPLRKLATSEGITSIKFFPSQPDLLVAGVKGTCIRIYDLRQDSDNPILQFPTTCVHNIAVDPTDDNYFVSAGPQRDTLIQIWDRRSGASTSAAHMDSGHSSELHIGPVLEVKNAFDVGDRSAPSNLWSMRYSVAQKGCLAVLSSSGQLRIVQTKQDYLEDYSQSHSGDPLLQQPALSSRKIYVNREYDVERSRVVRQHSREEAGRIVSFDFVNILAASGRPCAVLLRGNQEISIYELPRKASALAVSTRNEIIVSSNSSRKRVTSSWNPVGLGISFIQPNPSDLESSFDVDSVTLIQERTSRSRATVSFNKRNEDDELDDKQKLKEGGVTEDNISATKSYRLDIQDALAIDDKYRRRCATGYQFNCATNAAYTANKPYLQEMWIWLDRKSAHIILISRLIVM